MDPMVILLALLSRNPSLTVEQINVASATSNSAAFEIKLNLDNVVPEILQCHRNGASLHKYRISEYPWRGAVEYGAKQSIAIIVDYGSESGRIESLKVVLLTKPKLVKSVELFQGRPLSGKECELRKYKK